MVVCSQCYHENSDDAVHCEACGASLPVPLSCPNCGATVLSDANFCGQCGTKLPGTSASVAVPAMAAVPESASDVAIAEVPPAPPSQPEESDGDLELDLASTPNAAAETLSDAEAEWLAEDEEDDDLDDLELSWEAPPADAEPESEPVAAPTADFEDFDVLMTDWGADAPPPNGAPESEIPGEIEAPEAIETPEPDPVLDPDPAPDSESDSALDPDPAPDSEPDIDLPQASGEEGEPSPDPAIADLPAEENVPGTDTPVSVNGMVPDPETATVVQSHEKGQLLHLQTNTALPLPRERKVMHIGKPNNQVPPDVDVSDFPHAEIVSRIHADVHWDGSSYYLEDTGSANGTYVNSWPLPSHRRYQLRDGDRITLGKHDLISFVFQIVS